MGQDVAVDVPGEVSRCLVRTRRGHVAVCYHSDAIRGVQGMRMSRSCLALAREGLAVGGHHSGPIGAGGLLGHRTAAGQPPRRTCTHGALMLGAAVRTVGAGSSVMALGAARWNAMSARDCRCGRRSSRCQEALGRHPRWAVVGCLSAGQGHGGYARIATG
jgi:hypothetical protein